ncbi:MAG: phage shock protein A-like transcriptional regulator [Chlorobi bacterium]|jgi:phage shock protein A|nr:phage shock protein A-like transcriptional regulator [Chlorobiota bacterium]
MSIFGRMSDIFKANINDLLDRAEDPEKMIKQMVIEMEEAVNKATIAVGSAIANEKSLERQYTKQLAQVNDWQQKAVQAVGAGRDDLAKQALERKNTIQRNVTDLERMYGEAKTSATQLRGQLDQLKSKLDEARMRQNTLIARSQAAKAKKQIAQSFSGIGSDAFSKFDKLEQRVEKTEAEADAFAQLAGENTSLDDQFRQLGTSSAADDELAALKAQLGAGSSSAGSLPAGNP